MLSFLTGFAVRRPIIVIVVWLAALVAGFGVGTGVFERLVADVGTAPGSESARADDRLAAMGPQPESLTAVVSGRPATDRALLDSVSAAVTAVRAVPGVLDVAGPRPSTGTGQALLLRVTLAPGDRGETAAPAVAERLHEIDAPAVVVAGGPLTGDEFGAQAQADVTRAEIFSTPVLLVLLLLIFGGMLAAGLPLLIAVVGVGGTFGILYAFSLASDVSVYAIQVTTMLAVGLGVDYALLMVSRFREERASAPDVATAVLRTGASAGRTVFFSGLTVGVALCGLLVFPDPFLRSMGLAGAAVVAVDMLAALTLLPALLALVGNRIRPRRRSAPAGTGVFARVARGVQRRPVLTLMATAAGLLVLAVPALDLRLSTGDPRMLPTSTQTRQLWDALATHFPEQVGPDAITVVARRDATDPAVAELRDRIADVPGVAEATVEPAGTALSVIEARPVSAEGAARAVAAIRALPAPFEVDVTGDAARLADYRQMLHDRMPWAIAVVVLGTLVLLFLFTGSVLLPIKAVLTNVISIGAALGVVVWVFQDGLGYTHLTVPVLVAAIAFGLSVDYEVFLLSRIRERWLAGAGARGAVAEGIQLTGGIITSAALLLVVVFAGFILGGFAPIKGIGVGLVVAIALDATIVRMLMVPATMTLLARANWWAPGPLRRLHARFAPAPENAALENPEAASVRDGAVGAVAGGRG